MNQHKGDLLYILHKCGFFIRLWDLCGVLGDLPSAGVLWGCSV